LVFIKDLYHDEIRDGWLVKSDMKKIWNRQLEIWAEVDRICRKHDITYWAGYGTLLGAARHGGFIPWDEDFDLCMMRPEYDRFCAVLNAELNGEVFEIKHETFSITKISHSLTTALESNYGQENNSFQSLTIDIFALDIAPDGTENALNAVHALQEIIAAVTDFSKLFEKTHVKKDGRLVMELKVLKKISELPFKDRLAELYRYTYALQNQSPLVAFFDDTIAGKYECAFQKDWFRETIYLPFETVELPAPKMFDEILTSYYGDWRTPVRDGQNRLGVIHSADIPWREFLQLVDVKKILDDFNARNGG